MRPALICFLLQFSFQSALADNTYLVKIDLKMPDQPVKTLSLDCRKTKPLLIFDKKKKSVSKKDCNDIWSKHRSTFETAEPLMASRIPDPFYSVRTETKSSSRLFKTSVSDHETCNSKGRCQPAPDADIRRLIHDINSLLKL